MHLRCAHIRVDQYTDTWICHLHRGSRLPHAAHTTPHTSARPEVRGTVDVGAYSPYRSILLVLTHVFIITCDYRPTGSDGHERKDADAALRTIFMPFEAKGVLYAWGPVQPANGPPTHSMQCLLTWFDSANSSVRQAFTL